MPRYLESLTFSEPLLKRIVKAQTDNMSLSATPIQNLQAESAAAIVDQVFESFIAFEQLILTRFPRSKKQPPWISKSSSRYKNPFAHLICMIINSYTQQETESTLLKLPAEIKQKIVCPSNSAVTEVRA